MPGASMSARAAEGSFWLFAAIGALMTSKRSPNRLGTFDLRWADGVAAGIHGCGRPADGARNPVCAVTQVCLCTVWIAMSGIGQLNEKPLHASLKHWYARPGDRFEVAVDGYVIDIVRDNLLIEIQTANFASIKSKLQNLVRSHQVRLIYPIAQEKWIIRSATDGRGRVIRRKSPKRGRLEDLFWEMVSIPQLLANSNFALEVLMIKEEEARRYEGRRHWRRGGG